MATTNDLIAAYIHAAPLPENPTPAQRDRAHGQRRAEALAALQQLKDEARDVGLALHHAYRPEATTEVSVPLHEDSDWERIARWCSGTLDSGPDGTDGGEHITWITLPNGEEATAGTWITKSIDGQFHLRHEIAEPTETTLLQAQGVGWELGATAALAATCNDTHTARQRPANPLHALLPTPPAPRARAGHALRVTLTPSDGLHAALICDEPLTAACRQPYGVCELVTAYNEDPAGMLEDYQGEYLCLLDAPITVTARDEYQSPWKLTAVHPEA